jgi:superfamily II DNA or RNA helicase
MYLNETKLELLRNEILVEMPFQNEVERVLNYIDVGYDKALYKKITRDRWNPYELRPIKDAAELSRLMRRVTNSDPSRLENVRWLMTVHPRLVIFYNFNYELEILRGLSDEIEVLEWNGHQKDELPDSDKCDSDRWVYLVQYVAGAEGWNCTSTDAMILYSLTYSYKNFIQAQGRIDRLDTEYLKLYYYIFVSNLKIDVRIKEALSNKKSFNERRFMRENPEIFGQI